MYVGYLVNKMHITNLLNKVITGGKKLWCSYLVLDHLLMTSLAIIIQNQVLENDPVLGLLGITLIVS